MHRQDQTAINVARYISESASSLYRAEQVLFDRILRPGMTVADAGCGDGRLTRHLQNRGARVIAFDLHLPKLRQLATRVDPSRVHVVAMDLRSLGIRPATLDAFILGFNVLDFIFPVSERLRVLSQIALTLKPGGYLMLSSHNPIGTLLSPRGLRSARNLRWRATYLLSGDVGRSYFRDPNRLMLYQGTPGRVTRQVKDATAMHFVSALDNSGRIANPFLLGLFCPWPYYLFQARGPQPCC